MSFVCGETSLASQKVATESGMRGLMEDGVRLIRAGLTTPSEIGRVAV